MPLLEFRRAALLLCILSVCVCAEKAAASVSALSIPEIEIQLLPLSPCDQIDADASYDRNVHWYKTSMLIK
jgi:hypothetical protein